ncbi:MAG TPA: hypothetical protein VFI19_10625, partial [Nocardioides sp.]|nr:hypothetical protein [Nocardioides sp.]
MNLAERAGPRARPRRRFRQLVQLLRPAPDATPLVGQAPPMTLRQVVRRFWPDVRPLRWWLLLLVV